MNVLQSGMNATVDGTSGLHGGLVKASVMADTVVHGVFGRQLSPNAPTNSPLALHPARDGNIRGVMHFVLMEEHQMATLVDVLQDFMGHAVDCVRICQ